MRNPAEIPADRAETGIEALFEPQIVQLGGHRCAPGDRQGSVWAFDPSVGEGTYWYCIVDGDMAVGAFDFMLHADGGFSCDASDCFYFGSYSSTMLPYLGAGHEGADRTVMGHAWKRAPYFQRVHGGQRLGETFAALLPAALRRVSLELRCDPVVLSSAIAALDGSEAPPGLVSLLDGLRRARPSAVTANAYYRSKVVEACALILDWKLSRNAPSAVRLEPADSEALSRARCHLQAHLDRHVGTDELCRAACMGASKLIALFKAAYGATPQEYARDLRMDRACDLLTNTDLPIASIAAHLGFARQGSFSEAFKERHGMTPVAWRAATRGGRPAR